jgi:hypothetical protein
MSGSLPNMGLSPFLSNSKHLLSFIATTAEEASMETAKKYLGYLRSHHIDNGYNTTIFNDERIKRIITGASRIYQEKPKRERLEITKEILEAMLVNLHITHDDLNVRGEFTWSKWDNQSFLLHLSCGSVQFVHHGILLHLPASKSDPFRKGVSIPLSKSSDTTRPVSTLELLFQKYPKSNTDPLFCRIQGAFNRKWVLSKISQTLLLAGINPKGYSGHSFRRGAANSALKAGISREDIMHGKATPLTAIFLLEPTTPFYSHSQKSSTLILALHPRFLHRTLPHQHPNHECVIESDDWVSLRRECQASWSDHSERFWLPEAVFPYTFGELQLF